MKNNRFDSSGYSTCSRTMNEDSDGLGIDDEIDCGSFRLPRMLYARKRYCLVLFYYIIRRCCGIASRHCASTTMLENRLVRSIAKGLRC